ncbi:hypothetical protein L3Y34_000178 [Caenorhabditis briggsae]|uniref:Uncharacterized protein n=1 Tax=Caenorhabditis briggsae TaxID=6238 RepID=A0AAE9ILP5_CAEBR|nr:hypothetical protein L3Y34_000178 [Caenorhabditis briggsae]
MNLNDLQTPQNGNSPIPAPHPLPPPPPPPLPPQRQPRPGMKRPSGELSSDVALRSPLRERKKKASKQHLCKIRSTTNTLKNTTQGRITQGTTTTTTSVLTEESSFTACISESKIGTRAHRHHHDKEKNNHRHHRQKEEEYPESSKKDSNRDDKIKSPAKSPAVAQSPSGSDAENQKDPEKTWSPIVCFVRLFYYIVFLSFLIVFIFWIMATATSLHYVDIEFMEKKFMGN